MPQLDCKLPRLVPYMALARDDVDKSLRTAHIVHHTHTPSRLRILSDTYQSSGEQRSKRTPDEE